MRFTTLSSTTAAIVYLMSITGSVSAAPIADALAARDTFDAELDILEARFDDVDIGSREFDDLEDSFAREADTEANSTSTRSFALDVDVDDFEARAPSPGGDDGGDGGKAGVTTDASGKPIKRPVKRTRTRSSRKRQGKRPRSLEFEARSVIGAEIVPRGGNSNVKQGTITDSKGRPIKRPVKRTRSLEARAPSPGENDPKTTGVVVDGSGKGVKKPVKRTRTRARSTRRRHY